MLWIGTWNGLYSYDGYQIIEYYSSQDSPIQLSSNFITVIKEDKWGRLLVGTSKGLNVLDFKTKTNTVWTKALDKNLLEHVRKKNMVSQIIVSGQDIWLNLSGYLCRLTANESEWIQTEKIKSIRYFREDEKGLLWVVNHDLEIFILNKNGEILENYSNYKEALLAKDAVFFKLNNLATSPKNKQKLNLSLQIYDRIKEMETVWTLEEKPIFSLHPIQFNIQPSPNLRNLALIETDIEKFNHYYSDNVIWMLVQKKLYKVVLSPKYFETPKVLQNKSTRGMYEAADGTIFIGAYNQNIFYKHKHQSIEIADDYFVSTQFLPWDEQTLFTTTDGGGIMLMDVEQKRLLKAWPQTEEIEHCFNAIIAQDSTIWFSGNTNLFFIGRDLEPHPFRLPNGEEPFKGIQINSLFINHQDTFWVAGTEGLYRCYQESQHLEGEMKAEVKLSLKNIGINHIYEDQFHKFWLCTHKGLLYFDPHSERIEQAYSKKNGLPHELLYGALPQGDSVLWISTHHGLSRFHIPSKRFTNYYKKDGLSGNEFNRKSFFQASDGRMYFGGVNGVTVFAPEKIQAQKRQFQTFISKILQHSNHQKKVLQHSFSTVSPNEIILEPFDKFIEFFFASTDFHAPESNIFAYQLEGFDEDWVISKKNNVRYTNLDAGNYVFKVKTKNAEGLWSNNVVVVPLLVKTPFYQEWWFAASLFLLGSIIISIIAWNQLRQERRLSTLRNRIAIDLHDDISNTFNNISFLAKESQVKMPNFAGKQLQTIQKMSTNAIQNVQDVIWALNDEPKTLKRLLTRMQDFVDDVLKGKGFPVRFEYEVLDEAEVLDFLYCRTVLMIFKEAISNIIKHSHPEKVEIKIFKADKDHFKLKIVNFYQEKKAANFSTELGLPNMQKRAQSIGGTIVVEEKAGCFEFYFKKPA